LKFNFYVIGNRLLQNVSSNTAEDCFSQKKWILKFTFVTSIVPISNTIARMDRLESL
jgi:hypothetical protein